MAILEEVATSAEWWNTTLRDVGYPSAILFLIGLALWRSARWARPWLEKIAQTHLDFVGAIEASQRDMASNVSKMCAAFDLLQRELAEHRSFSREAVSDIRDDIRALHEKVK